MINIPFTNIKLGLNSGTKTPKVRGAAGVGYEIANSQRTRRLFALITGLMASADRHMSKYTLGRMREYCRMHDRQGSFFSGILDRGLDNIFGANFDFIPNTGDKDLNSKVKDYISKAMDADVCDACGVRNFSEMAKTAIRSIWNDGDNLLVKRKDGSMLAFEADQIETPTDKGADGGRRIVLGVELNDVNRPVAYYVKRRKSKGDHGMTQRAEDSTRVLRAHAIMPAYRKRYNQTRGVPFLAAILAMFDRFDEYLDNESFAALLNATGGFKITKQPTEEPLAGVVDNEDTATSSTFEKVQKFLPGWVWEGGPGEDVDMVTSKRPGENFEPYIVTCCRIIGVGIGYPLELLMLDFSKTNYSSARASLGESRRMFRGWQKFAQTQICMPWYRWQISRGIATGELPARPELFKARCQWPAWEYIDPMKAAKGNEIAIKSRTKSISDCIREQGREPDEVFAEIAADREKLKTLGIPLQETKEKDQEKDEDTKDEDKDDE